jgi:hypothetical protein
MGIGENKKAPAWPKACSFVALKVFTLDVFLVEHHNQIGFLIGQGKDSFVGSPMPVAYRIGYSAILTSGGESGL